MNRIFLISILFLAPFFLFACHKESQNLVCFKDNCYEVELAQTPEERALGLMHRAHIAKDKGMLFIFPKDDLHSFWMKNTLVPLDIIWLSSEGEVVDMHKRTPPCEAEPCPKYKPSHPARYVLELAAGVADSIGLSSGHRLKINLK